MTTRGFLLLARACAGSGSGSGAVLAAVLGLAAAACGNSESERPAPKQGAPAPAPGADERARGADPAPANPLAPPRRSVECARYLEILGGNSAGGIGVKTQAGQWGGLHPDFQKLPEGAQLCGAAYLVTEDGKVQDGKGLMVSVYVRSPLDKGQLEAFYAPLASGAGCTPSNTGGDEFSVGWQCPVDKGSSLTLQALPDYQIYGLSGLLR